MASLVLAGMLFLASCSGFSAVIWTGGVRAAAYYYVAPYAYIENHRFSVYWLEDRSYVIYRGVTYFIIIYSDRRVWAPRDLIILLR